MVKIPFRISSKVFNPVFLDTINNKHRYQIFYGGSGSGKSVFVAQRIIKQFFEGGHNFLVVRQVSKSNRHSTFALLKQILSVWKVPVEWYRINKSEMIITNTVNGSQISFAGLDDVEKLKSITFENGILTDIWIEEASEIRESDFNQLDLRLRGLAKVPLTITMTFNPIDVNFWAKRRFFDNTDDKCYIKKTTYLDNRFIDDDYKQVLENLKEVDPVYYRVYALGDWGVLGNQIYHNYIIEDFDYSHFDDFVLGTDFGYNNPSCCLKLARYDNEIYVCDEVYQSKLTNPELVEIVKKAFGTDIRMIADSAEQDRIKEFSNAGYFVEGCKKGDNSVKAGIDYLRSVKIHIHKTNCPETAKEIGTYKYREDRQGNILDDPVKFNDHAMDALRYGCEIWRGENIVDYSNIEIINNYEY